MTLRRPESSSRSGSLAWTGAAALAFVLAGASASAAPPQKKAAKKGPSIVLPAKKSKGAAPKEPKTMPSRTTPEKVDIPGVTNNGAKSNVSDELRGPTRIDFDDRLIQGQTNKSGAVYLFDRKETGISSMVKRRKSFRQLTLGTIYDR
jgi:hypothetical protein